MRSNVDERDLKYLLDHAARKLRYKSKRNRKYVNKLLDQLDELNDMPWHILSKISYHQFYLTLRNLIRDLLIDWSSSQKLFDDDIDLLQAGILFLQRLVDAIQDVTKILTWLIEPLFLNAFAKCLSNLDRLLVDDDDKYIFKQLIHLFDVFSSFYERLPKKIAEEQDFDRLFTATMDCLVSSNYDRVFRKFKVNTQSMSSKEKFFLIKCPSLVSSYRGSQSKKIIELILDTLIPRYALLLDQHMHSIDQWNSPFIHVVHHLLLTIIYAKGSYSPYASGEPFQWLIDHLICIINKPSFIKNVNEKSTNPETMLIDSTLRTLTAFVHEPDLLAYMKNLKITSIFRSLISLANESIVLHVYVMLAYTLEEDEIKASRKESGRFLSKIFDSLRKKLRLLSMTHGNEESLERNISLLIEALQALVQHDQIKSEILKQNAVSVLIDGYQHFNPRSKRLLLESLGSITFDHEAARLLRHNTQFIDSIKDIQTTTDDGIHKAAEKIIWNLIKEPQREKETIKKETEEKEEKREKIEYQYDIMISYCHADKELVYRVHKFLSAKGFKIWVDRDNIYGPAMQSMADAVEKSEFILLCMSDSYKRSVYCQAEAEYAFRCKRHLLPCIVRQGYRADGWLGLVIGSRIYVDFGRLEFQEACELLLKEISLQRENQLIANQSLEKEGIAIETIEKSNLPNEYLHRNTSQAIYRSNSIDHWTRRDVLDFLYDTDLYHMMPICELMTGLGLMKLFRICQVKPNRFYSRLNDELNRRFNGLHLPIGIFTQFLSEMDHLVQPSSLEVIQHTAPQSEYLSPSSSSPTVNSSPSLQSDKPLVPLDSSSPQQITPPSTTTIRTSRNVQITEQTAFEIRSE